ncbi:MAG: SAVED domain-containing protein [Chloroflexota bacterium]
MRRPIQSFLSHQHNARPQVMDLEAAMRRRGLASWRDRKSLALGDETEAMVRRAINKETSGFILFGSKHLARSDFVWRKEWRWANDRRERELGAGLPSPYRISPLFVEPVTPDMLGAFALAHEQSPDDIRNGETLAGAEADRDRVARQLLAAAVADQTQSQSGSIRIHLTTFATLDPVDADILVDWRPETEASETRWDELLSARDDLRDVLRVAGHPIEVDAQARLPAAFCFGQAFPLVARIPVTAIHRNGDRWAMAPDPDLTLISASEERLEGDPSLAAVEVSLARDVSDRASAARATSGLKFGRRLKIGFAPGVDKVDHCVAAAAAAHFGRELRRLGDEGVREAHLWLAAPAALAVLLGASVNAGPVIIIASSSHSRI